MARWKLMTSHYLLVADPTKWEYKEVDRGSGREKRKQVTVPRFLDINDPGDWTNRFGDVGVSHGGNSADGAGEIIVCLPGKGGPHDIEFYGDPTPDMSPVDEEAMAISASFAERWRYKPEGAEISYSQSMIDNLNQEQADAAARPQQVEVAGLADMVVAIGALTAQNAELMKALSNGKASRL